MGIKLKIRKQEAFEVSPAAEKAFNDFPPLLNEPSQITPIKDRNLGKAGKNLIKKYRNLDPVSNLPIKFLPEAPPNELIKQQNNIDISAFNKNNQNRKLKPHEARKLLQRHETRKRISSLINPENAREKLRIRKDLLLDYLLDNVVGLTNDGTLLNDLFTRLRVVDPTAILKLIEKLIPQQPKDQTLIDLEAHKQKSMIAPIVIVTNANDAAKITQGQILEEAK